MAGKACNHDLKGIFFRFEIDQPKKIKRENDRGKTALNIFLQGGRMCTLRKVSCECHFSLLLVCSTFFFVDIIVQRFSWISVGGIFGIKT